MSDVMVKNADKYQGQYVCLETWDSDDVISHSESAAEAYREAVSLGCDDPVIVYCDKRLASFGAVYSRITVQPTSMNGEEDKPDPAHICFFCGQDSCDCDML